MPLSKPDSVFKTCQCFSFWSDELTLRLLKQQKFEFHPLGNAKPEDYRTDHFILKPFFSATELSEVNRK